LRFLADESLHGQIVARLRQDGHHVDYVAEMDPGVPDEEVLAAVNLADVLLMTADRDFGELVFRGGQVMSGVVFVRLGGLPGERRAEIVSAAVQRYGEELRGAFTVIAPGQVRIRHRRP